jgi:hypothetical protein
MTASEIITKFRNMVDDQLDADYELQLVNDAKDEVEAMKDWEVLIKEQSYTITAGQSYADSQSLPTRFIQDLRVIENDDLEYTKISFQDRYQKINSTNAYFLDMANNKIGFAGLNLPALTMYLYYTQGSVDMGLSDSWTPFPERFHKIIPYQMAKIYYASDAGEKGRAWDDRWDAYYQTCLSQMTQWDDRLKTKNRRVRQSLNRENGLNMPPVWRR